ncbi:hypothetical protein DFH28DRAFT_959744 [Melampsora americana]|nr:hypothetical protein DFH28DRAFT_959744 [Melampsora americana]
MNSKRKSAVLQSGRHSKRARVNDRSYAQELDLGSESAPPFSPETTDTRERKTLRSGRTWVPTPLHELEPGRVRNRTEVVSSSASASSVSISSPDTVSPIAKKIKKLICGPRASTSRILQDKNGREARRKSDVGQTKDVTTLNKHKETQAPVKFTSIQPRTNYLGLQNAKVPPRQSDISSAEELKITARVNKCKEVIAPVKLTAAEQVKKKKEEEAFKIAQREARTRVIASRLSDLVDIRNRSRGVQSICADRFKWNSEFWSGYFKQNTKVLMLGPKGTPNGSKHIKGKRKSLGQMDWSVDFEMDALELCILNNGGDPPTRSSDWLEDYASENFTSVFFHRNCVEEIFDQAKSSLYKMTSKSKPRIQFFEFGKSASGPSPVVEQILKAGAIMIPTIESLIKSAEQSENSKTYHRLRDANKINPFLRIFLPRMETPEVKELEKLPIEDSIEILNNFHSMNQSIHVSLETFILSTEVGFRLLNETFGKDEMDDDDFDDENPEIKEIIAALLVIRKKLRKHFRRFVLLVDGSSHILKTPDHRMFHGIEVMSIEEGCKLAETSGF